MNAMVQERLSTWPKDAKSAKERKLREKLRHYKLRLTKARLIVSNLHYMVKGIVSRT